MVDCYNPTTHFSSGKDLLLHYDIDKDGKIGNSDLQKAFDDWVANKITDQEMQFLVYAKESGKSIDELCPSVGTLVISTNPSGANVYVDEVYKGTT